MIDLSDLAKLPLITKFIEGCLVDSVPAGAVPKDVMIQLPDGDGAKVPARYTGFPPGLVATNVVSVRATPQDPIRYLIAGTSGATAPKTGKKLDHVFFVSSTAPNADYSTIAAANSAASAGDIILLDAETWGSAVITKAVTLMGLDPVNTILTASSDDSNTLRLTGANGITVRNLTLENTGAGTTCTCLDITSGHDNHIIDNVIMTKTSGAPTNAYGIYNNNGTNILLNNVRITVTTGTNKYGYYSTLTTGSSARIVGGSYEGSTDDIRLDDAQASVELNDPILENDDLNIVAGSATGWYLDSSGNQRSASGDLDVNGNDIILDADADTKIDMSGGDDIFRINTAGNKAFDIDAAGIITQPLQSCFLAVKGAASSNVTGDNTYVAYMADVAGDWEIVDQNGDYNLATGVFTAPVDGVYAISTLLYITGVAAGHTRWTHRIQLSTNTVFVLSQHAGNVRDSSDQLFSSTVQLFWMDANDTAFLDCAVFAAAKTVDIQGHATILWTTFGASLIN